MTIRTKLLLLFVLIGAAAGGFPPPVFADNAREGLRARIAEGRDAQGTPQEKREALKEKLMKLPPEERRAKIQQLKQSLNAEQQQKLAQKKEQFQNRWNTATPEQRAQFCTNVRQKCSGGDGQSGAFACKVAQAKCAGQ